MVGKGSVPRPFSVDAKTFSNNWNRAFDKSSRDWFLVAINPWYKIYYNPRLNKTEKFSYK